MSYARLALAALAAATVAACSGGESPAADPTAASASPSAAASPGGAVTPDAGGQVIVVEMYTDENGSYFKPADFEARKGDVVRFTLAQGVHNVSFPADSNPGTSGLPAPGPMLQLPGQTTDVKVTWDPGTYFYQCDPHALLGMVGRITVK